MGIHDPGKWEEEVSFDAACAIAQMQESASNGPCPVHGRQVNCGWPANDCECAAPILGHEPTCPRHEPTKYTHTGFECGAL